MTLPKIYSYEREGYSVKILVDHLDVASFHKFTYPPDSTMEDRKMFLLSAHNAVMASLAYHYDKTGSFT